jgi:peptidoglycan/LPS O-acetylase OafA/YrhL
MSTGTQVDSSLALSDSSLDPPKQQATFYRPELDALRFFACLGVFVHHVGSTRAFLLRNRWTRPVEEIGAFGVCLFFLLSAYLISELLWKERAKTGSIHLRSFYVRRILRIWPLYFGCILLFVLLSPFFPRFLLRPGILMALTFMAGNWYFAAYGWTNYALGPMWSISVEEQFYLLVPTIAKFGGKRSIWILSFAFLAASQVMLLYLGIKHITPNPSIWTNSIVQFQFFAAGCILALVLQDRRLDWDNGLVRGMVRLAFFLSGLILWGIAGNTLGILGDYPLKPSTAGLCIGYGLVLVGSVLLFLAVYGMPSRWIPRWVIYLGKISFGLYLLQGFTFEMMQHTPAEVYIDRMKRHFPVVDILLEIGLTFSVAALSYRYFEKPFLRLKDRFAIVRSRPI